MPFYLIARTTFSVSAPATELLFDSQSTSMFQAPEPVAVACPYCRTSNEIGEGRCVACGAPLGDAQPVRCPSCERLLPAGTPQCPQCGERLAV